MGAYYRGFLYDGESMTAKQGREEMTVQKAEAIVDLHKHLAPLIDDPISDQTKVIIAYCEAKGFLEGRSSLLPLVERLVNALKLNTGIHDASMGGAIKRREYTEQVLKEAQSVLSESEDKGKRGTE